MFHLIIKVKFVFIKKYSYSDTEIYNNVQSVIISTIGILLNL